MKHMPRVRMGELGVSAKNAREFLKAAGEMGMHSFVLTRHGKVAAEAWWKPYAPDYAHMLHSLSKSFTSTAFGFAVQEGLASLDDRVMDFFPEALTCEPCENMKKMTVRHLLTMNTGHIDPPNVISGAVYNDWVEWFLRSYIPLEPGTKFTYNTAATYMVSAIVQKVTGQPIVEYLKPRLFDPLGFGEYWWDTCPKGINVGGFGFNVTTEDIAKFGNLMLNRGAYNGKQLLDPAWVDMATSWQVPNGPGTRDWCVGYGFQFWQCSAPDTFRGDGAYGQLCVVNRKLDAVFACTAQVNNMQDEMDIIYKYLFEPMQDEEIPENDDEAAFAREAADLTIRLPEGEAHDRIENAVSEKTYDFAPNSFGIKTLRFHFGEENHVTFENASGISTLPIGYGRFIEANSCAKAHCGVMEPLYRETACAGAWKDGHYLMRVVFTRTSTLDTLEFSFTPHGVRVEVLREGCFIGGRFTLCGILRA